MEYSDILALAKAGFTAQQIGALNQLSSLHTSPASQVVNTGAPNQMDAMTAQIAALTQAVQGSNIMAAQQPAQMTADDVLAEIINPPVTTGSSSVPAFK